MQIIPATPKDETAIKTLLQNCHLPFEDLTPAHMATFWAIPDEDQMIAAIGLEICGNYGLLRSLAVSEAWRGQGLGVQMVEHIETQARDRQIAALYLLTTTADLFFVRLGYQIVSRDSAPDAVQETAEFQSICPTSAVCMFKQL
jgi:amino-acid N-acetyltransferase